MRLKSILLICAVFFTAIVAFTAFRIEYLNAMGGHVLPLHWSEHTRGKWEIAELNVVLDRLDNQFFERRHGPASLTNDDGSVPKPVVFGAPYSANEQRSIDSVKVQHDILTKLHWNVSYPGWAQYFLAPAALLMAIICGLCFSGVATKIIAFTCGSMCFVGIFLALVRGYWSAVG